MELIDARRKLLGLKRIKLTWDASSNGKYIGANGTIGSSSNFHYSELLPVKTDSYIYCFTFTDTINSRRTRIHGYDASGTWVRQLSYFETFNGSYKMDFQVTDDIKYIRISNGIQATRETIYAT